MLRRPLLTVIVLLLGSLPNARGAEPPAEDRPLSLRLRIAGSRAYDREKETEIREALIFDTFSVFIGAGKGAGGLGRAQVGTYALFVYLSTRERGCGRLQEVVPSLVPPKKLAEEFANRTAATRPQPIAPFVPFDGSDDSQFDLQLLGIDYLDHPQLNLIEAEPSLIPDALQKPSARKEGTLLVELIAGAKILHSSGVAKLAPCKGSESGALPLVAEADLPWCRELPIPPRVIGRFDSTDDTHPQGAFWAIIEEPDPSNEAPAADGASATPSYRFIADVDEKLWSLHADLPAKRCPTLRHVHVERKGSPH